MSDLKFDRTEEAGNGAEAIEKLKSAPVDIVLCDVNMPEMGGLEFIRKLMKYYPKPVIIISTIAKVGSKIQKTALSAGACDVIDKESLSIYGGLEKAKSILLPRLKAAAMSSI